jgi:hypothetical protein
MSDLGHHLRFGGPRLMILLGERGTGRTSVLHALGNFASNTHHISLYPEENPAQTLLNELYCLIAGYDVPGSSSKLIEQLVSSLEGKSIDLPLISFDFPGINGLDLALVFERITPILARMRALIVIALTPAQLSAWSEDLREPYHISPPLVDFDAISVRSLIDSRMQKVSKEKWVASDDIIASAIAATGGRPAILIRYLRDIIDSKRGVSSPLSRKLEVIGSMDIENAKTNPNDARNRMAPEISENTPLDIEDEPKMEGKDEETLLDGSESLDIEELNADDELFQESDLDFQIPEIEDDIDVEDESNPLPSLELEDIVEPDMSAAFGGAVLEMDPGTEPPAERSAFGGLKNRHRNARIEQGLDRSLERSPSNGPMNAKPDTSIPASSTNPNIESEETAYWVSDSTSISEIEPEDSHSQPVMDPMAAKTFGDALRAQRPIPRRSEIPNALDIGRITNLDEREILIVEAATAREVSPSDQALQAHLSVGRPRLSQIFNGLQKAGILAVRKKGRTRLFRLSESAKAHLSGGHMEA